MIANPQTNRLRQLAKALNLGAFFYRTYHAPKAFLKECQSKGIDNIVLDAWAQQQMEEAAYQLQVLPLTSPLKIHFLTGRKFWYQTCFCTYSMAKHTNLAICPVLYDDGSLEQRYQDAVRKIFPTVQIFLKPEIDARIEEFLPQRKFPHLRERRQNYPNIRKLTDVHAGGSGWNLVLDSDMLFFRPPTLLLDWLQSPQMPCYMVDIETAYGYSETLMASLAQAPIPGRVNVGICGLNSSEIDWEQLEYWCKTLIEQQGTHYYQEQALIAMLMAGRSCVVAPAEDYIVMPAKEEVMQPKAVLHHYVADSKSWYFRYGWKHIVKSDRQLAAMRCSA